MITIATQAASRSSETSEISAATISSLSASGSISFPNVVTCSPAAGDVAVEPVGQRGQREHDRRDHVPVRRLVEQRDDDHRHRDDPQHGEDVGTFSGNTRRSMTRDARLAPRWPSTTSTGSSSPTSPGSSRRSAQTIAEAGGLIGDIVTSRSAATARSARSPSRCATTARRRRVAGMLEQLDGVRVISYFDRALQRPRGRQARDRRSGTPMRDRPGHARRLHPGRRPGLHRDRRGPRRSPTASR